MRLDDLVAVNETFVWVILLVFGGCGMLYCLSQTFLWGLAYSYPLAVGCWMPVFIRAVKIRLAYEHNTAEECAVRAARAREKGLPVAREDGGSNGRSFNDGNFVCNVDLRTLYRTATDAKAKGDSHLR